MVNAIGYYDTLNQLHITRVIYQQLYIAGIFNISGLFVESSEKKKKKKTQEEEELYFFTVRLGNRCFLFQMSLLVRE